jgi:hypothetical protein
MKKSLADPKPEAEEKPNETAWADEPSEVFHLTNDTFDKYSDKTVEIVVIIFLLSQFHV